MRYSITRLCGGKALMAAPRDPMAIDLDHAAVVLGSAGLVKAHDDMMLVMSWKGMEITLYSQGKIMFHPLDDRNTAILYADEILGMLG
jgi:hypothetical protein